MQIEIYSKMADTPEYRIETGGRPATWQGELDDLRDLEDAFRYFNRVDEADCERLERIGYKLPSLSVGDIVTVDGNPHVVASMGFAPISADEVERIKTMQWHEVMTFARTVGR